MFPSLLLRSASDGPVAFLLRVMSTKGSVHAVSAATEAVWTGRDSDTLRQDAENLQRIQELPRAVTQGSGVEVWGMVASGVGMAAAFPGLTAYLG